jgi:hypothetical protein
MTENGTGKSLKKIVHSIHHTKEEGSRGSAVPLLRSTTVAST